jgi:hypothetical protein
MIGGSGARSLLADQARVKTLAKVVKAHAHGCVTDLGVTRHLAAINLRVSETDRTVGRGCIVTWRGRTGGNQSFDGTAATDCHLIPSIGGGIDLSQLLDVLMPIALPNLRAALTGEPRPMDPDAQNKAISEELAKLPHEPDDDLQWVQRRSTSMRLLGGLLNGQTSAWDAAAKID